MSTFVPAVFDDHAQSIAKRQYMQPTDGDVYGMFRRVADWVAGAERSEQNRQEWGQRFFELMASKRFCPGGRVLAGAGTQHGNVLNCFVQGATEYEPSSFDGVMEVATKLALVTKVGGGNGVNLDPYLSRKNAGPRGTVRGFAYISAEHADVDDFIKGLMRPPINPDGDKEIITVRNWTRVVYGLLKPEQAALARRNGVMTVRDLPAEALRVPDDMRGIIEAAKSALAQAKLGAEPHVDFSHLRPEGAEIKGSGGTSSGPVSFLMEIFDNFLEWANLGAEKAGPIATLRYVYAPVLRVVRQGGTRRGAGMATISVDHPDLLDFLTAKDLDREAGEGDISTFNISIMPSDEFIGVLQADGLWAMEPAEVPGKYYPVSVPGEYKGTLPELADREQDGARPIPVYGGKVPAKWLWHEIAWHAWATGEPGLIFVDRVNELSALKGLGERYAIRSTNPCVTADTWVQTAQGSRQVKDLIDRDYAAVVDGKTYPAKGFWSTGVKPVFSVKTKRGYSLRLTGNHPLKKVTRQTRHVQETAWVETQDLRPGDSIMLGNGRGVQPWQGAGNFGEGWLLGSLVGDGTFLPEKKMAALDYWGDRRMAFVAQAQSFLGQLEGRKLWQSENAEQRRVRLSSDALARLAQQFGLEYGQKTISDRVEEASHAFYRGFLQGLFDADGSVQGAQDKGISVRLSQSDLGLLHRAQRMLARVGILSSVYENRRDAGSRLLPDGKGGSQHYPTKAQHELVIANDNLLTFAQQIGFSDSTKQKALDERLASYRRVLNQERFSDEIIAIEPAGEAEVFDTTVAEVHAFDANCILAHNCGEIPLTVGEPCDLGAINLAAYVEESGFNYGEFRKDVRTTIRFLDNVLDVNVFALEDNRTASQTLRRLGLGVMGLADALIKLGLPYSSEAGRRVVSEIMNVMREEGVAESENLGRERGVFEVYTQNRSEMDKLGIAPRRNVAVLTVAPTGTTSMLMGVSSGIEPMFSPFMWRRIGGQYKALLHPLFVEMMEQYPASGQYAKDGKWDWDALVEAIQANHGTVKGMAGIPEAIGNVFEGAHDVPPLDHVRMQGAVQVAFDAAGYAANSLSKTINLSNDATVEDVENAYSEAFRTGCKGITVYRDGSRQFQVLSVSKEEKKAEGQEQRAESQKEETVAVQPALLDVPSAPTSPAERVGTPMFERTGRLVGYTDMVKLTNSDGTRRGFLVTVNMQGDHPVEVILTSGKAGDEANADSEALGRIISIALQYGVPVDAMVKTLRGINGGLYGSYQGRFVTSKADLIAVALETTAKLEVSGRPAQQDVVPQALQRAMTAPALQNIKPMEKGKTGLGKCPECGDENLVREEGCTKCYSCGYSKCG